MTAPDLSVRLLSNAVFRWRVHEGGIDIGPGVWKIRPKSEQLLRSLKARAFPNPVTVVHRGPSETRVHVPALGSDRPWLQAEYRDLRLDSTVSGLSPRTILRYDYEVGTAPGHAFAQEFWEAVESGTIKSSLEEAADFARDALGPYGGVDIYFSHESSVAGVRLDASRVVVGRDVWQAR